MCVYVCLCACVDACVSVFVTRCYSSLTDLFRLVCICVFIFVPFLTMISDSNCSYSVCFQLKLC